MCARYWIYAQLLLLLTNMVVDIVKIQTRAVVCVAASFGWRKLSNDNENWIYILENFIGMIQEREDCND